MRRRVIVLGLLLVLVTPVALWGVLNVFLTVGVPRLVTADRISLDVRDAWVDLHGVVHVDGLVIGSMSDKDRWQLHADGVTASIELKGLRDKRFVARDVHAETASFQWAPLSPEETPPPRTKPQKPRWFIALDDVVVEEVQSVQMGDQRLTDAGRASGDITIDPVAGDHVSSASLDVVDAKLLIKDVPVMAALEGQIGISVDAFVPKENRGPKALGFLTTKVQLDGELLSLAFVGSYFESTPWVQLAGGSGAVDIDLRVTRGQVDVGSRMHATVAGIQGHLFSYAVTGDGTLDVDAIAGLDSDAKESQDVGPQQTKTKMVVAFDQFTIQKDDATVPHLEGKGLVLTAIGPTALDRPPSSLDVVVELPDSKIGDMRVYNSYLPTGAGVSIQGGTGRASGHLEVSAIDKVAHGQLDLVTHDGRVKVDEVEVSGDFALHAKVSSDDLAKGRYELGGTHVSFRDIAVTGTARTKDESTGWWALLDIPSGHAAVGGDAFLDTKLTLQCRDSVPFIALLSTLKPVPGWARGMLATDDVKGSARIRLGQNLVEVKDFDVEGDSTHVLLEMLKRDGQAIEGIAYAQYRSLAIGVRMHDSKQEIQVISPRKWYDGLAAVN